MQKATQNKHNQWHAIALLLITPCLIIYLPHLVQVSFFMDSFSNDFPELPLWISTGQNSLYVLISAALLLGTYFFRQAYCLSIAELKSLLWMASLWLAMYRVIRIIIPFGENLTVFAVIAFSGERSPARSLRYLQAEAIYSDRS